MFGRCVSLCIRKNPVSSRFLSSTSVTCSVLYPKPGGPVLVFLNHMNIELNTRLESRVKGTVKWFDAMKGFGFIVRSDTQQDVFVHLRAITCKNPLHQTRTLADGESVEFDIVQGKSGFVAACVTGPGGGPVQGTPLAMQSRKQMQTAAGFNSVSGQSSVSGSFGAGGHGPSTQQGFAGPGPIPGGFGSGPVAGAGAHGFGNPAPSGFGYAVGVF